MVLIAGNKYRVLASTHKDFRNHHSHSYNKKKLDNLKINDFSYTFKRPEVIEKNATPKSEERDASRKTAEIVYLEQMLLEP